MKTPTAVCYRRCRCCGAFCLALLASAASPAPATAQTVPSLPPPPPQDDAAPVPHLLLHPSISFTNLGYDSNVFNLPKSAPTPTPTPTPTPATGTGTETATAASVVADERRGDWVASLATGLAPVWRVGDVMVSGRAGLVFNYFQQFVSERGIDRNAGGRLDVPVSRVRLHLSGGYANLRQRVNFEIDQRARRAEDNAAAGADIALGARTMLGLEVRRSAVTFASDDVLTLPLRETLNREERTALASFSYAITPITSFVVTGDTGTHHFELSPGRDGRSAGLAAGVAFSQNGLLNGQASIGWRRVTVSNPLIPAFGGVAGSLDLGTTIGLGTRLGLRARRDVVFSADVLSPYYAQISAGGSITQAVGERVEVGVRADRVWLDYVRAITETAPAYRERVDVLGGVFTVRLPRGWRVSVNVETMRRNANSDPLRDYTTQRIYTVLTPSLKF
jgi:hypothetical protein